MNTNNDCILTINGGSSSIKFALYRDNKSLVCLLHGSIDSIGQKGSKLTYNDEIGNPKITEIIEICDYHFAANFLMDWLEKHYEFSSVKAIGHRVVHGMNHSGHELITNELLVDLHHNIPYDPDHLPEEIELIEIFRKHYPKLPQVACFDTTFHCTMPRVAKLLPIPRRFDNIGIRRYGFHGLSYAYLMEELARVVGTKVAQGRVILAHLGSGASMAAVYKGKSIDTSMGFTPAGGLMMGTRPGDLDPGVAWYMMQSEKMIPKQFNTLINHESGLLGVSETSSDMHDLLDNQKIDIRAAEAVELFCYQVKKWIGSFAAVLGGLDTLVFAGGIGENSPEIRTRICEGLGFLGIEIEKKRNKANSPVISTDSGQTDVRVIRTNEELMIAKIVSQFINLNKKRKEKNYVNQSKNTKRV